MNTKALFLLRSVIVFIGLILLAGTSLRAEEKLVKVADGVYGIKGKGAKVNTGIVVGSKGYFLFPRRHGTRMPSGYWESSGHDSRKLAEMRHCLYYSPPYLGNPAACFTGLLNRNLM